jgi:O-antigen/teichoic acid export membrane protein
MNLVRRNLLANLISNGYLSLVILLCIPCYTAVLGMESWGLVGFFIILNAVVSQFGAGLNLAVSRELARLSALGGAARQMRDTVRSLEAVYWLLTAAVGLAIVLGAPFIGRHWVQAKTLSADQVTQAVMLMGLAVALQLPCLFYSGGLLGLQRQTLLSVVNVAMNSLRFLGSVAVLWWISPTIQAFFIWQAVAGAVYALTLAWCVWRSLPAAEQPAAVRRDVLGPLWSFVLGATGLSLAALGLTHLDKVLLSHLLDLEAYGYYMLAYMAGVGLYIITGAVFTAFLPQLTQRVSLNEREQLVEQYHLGSQIMAVLLLSAAAVGAVFSRELLFVWTGDAVKAEKACLVLSLLLVGNALNSLVNLPYALQLANGCTRIALTMNLGALVVMVPLIVVLTLLFGPVGAAGAWVALNVLYLAVGVGVTHRRFLPGQSWRWYGHGVLAPLVAAGGVVLAARWLMPAGMGRWPLLGGLAAVSVVCLSATALATPLVRQTLSQHLGRRTSAGGAAER